jgi:hypothetical protein
MSEVRESCRRCGQALAPVEFEDGRAVRLLGRTYCAPCLECKLHGCFDCHKPLHAGDFQNGRALCIQDRRLCASCAERFVRRTGDSTRIRLKMVQVKAAAAVAAVPAERDACQRAFERYVPPRDCILFIPGSGLQAVMGRNRGRLWIDVSEGGGRAIIEGRCDRGDPLHGRIRYAPRDLDLAFVAGVRHSKPSETNGGCQVVGFSFERPAPELSAFLRDLVSRLAALAPPVRKPKPAAPSKTA